jgi:hypothetical protein
MPYAWAWKQNNMCCLLQIHLEELGKWRSDHTKEIIYKLNCIACASCHCIFGSLWILKTVKVRDYYDTSKASQDV